MRLDEPLVPEDPPPPPSPESSLDASEEEALLRHLSRYQARKVRRRGRTLVAAGTVVAGAVAILMVVALVRSPRADAPPSRATPAPETSARAGTTTAPPATRERVVAGRAPVASTAAPPGSRTASPETAPPAGTPPAPPTTAPTPTATAAAPTPPSAASHATSSPAPPPATAPPAATLEPTAAPVTSRPPAAPAPAPSPSPAAAVAYQPRERLTLVRAGDTKDKVFDRFGTTFEQRGAAVVRVDGMRLRASGRSARHGHLEVADVTLADATSERLHWFLFGDGRLIAWGRPEEWPATVQQHQIEIDYSPAARSRP